jgi:hypothetical protein
MNIIDFFIGLTLMNALPHFVLGIWKRRMLSAFGFGNLQNILYGLLNFLISISLYLYQYGLDHLLSNGIYVGALTLLIIYFLTSRMLFNIFNKNPNE